MATFTIYDPAMGMIPKTEPKRYSVVQVSSSYGTDIGRFAPVVLNAGYAENCAADATLVTGVAMHHVPASTGGDLIICDDPYQVYECQADGAILQADIGKYIPLETNGRKYDHSTATFDESAATLVAAAGLPFKIVGLVKTVNGPSTKFLCRIPEPQFSKDFPES